MKKKMIATFILFVFTYLLVGCNLATQTTQDTQTTTTTTATLTTTTTTQSTTTTTRLSDTIPLECQEISVVDGWVPIWCDEFEVAQEESIVDLSKWTYATGGGGFGNNEEQYYKYADPDNIKIEDGKLVITALYETYDTNDYTSTKLWTVNTASWKYGKFEMRAKLPYGRGTWPAFWMMPLTSKYGGWPDSGEIDIMEHVGYDMNVVHGTIHTDRFYGSNGRGSSTTSLLTSEQLTYIDVANEFHTYSIIWDETSITWYFDGLEFANVHYDPYYQMSSLYDVSVDWPFDQRFYLILNLAIGGNWGGARGIDNTIFPATFEIDYVRVYQRDYISDDTENPSKPTSPFTIRVDETEAYLVWGESSDDMMIKNYEIYVNNVLSKKTSVPGVLLTNLMPNADNFIKIIAVDYAGNQSVPLETVITT